MGRALLRQRPAATEQGEYVTAVNCLKEIALQQMIQTKKRFGKEDKYIAWHGYQSFKPGEVTPELIHEFIDKIVVYAPKYLDGKRYQVVDVYYSGVGILRELSPEEMEEAFQKRLAQQSQGKEIPA